MTKRRRRKLWVYDANRMRWDRAGSPEAVRNALMIEDFRHKEPEMANKADVCHTVIVDHMAFSPSQVKAQQGDCVCWEFKQAGHSVVADDGKCFDSGIKQPGDTFEYKCDQQGEIKYHCGPMPQMTGCITVGPPRQP